MNTLIKNHQRKLKNKYKQLIELAYNLKQSDASLSDALEYQAILLHNKINRLKYLNREQSQSII
ncbi:Lacal_2735 family protein [uncultured Algibacter sp.]|uniref:Lacal_2735 family protein n=1 Tax=uncultured Algibacter sp. TaxID=298659 RepID=UPI00263398BE|nr:Lacal_2735 family protein [uncultured Algibacter sp.]